MSLREVYRQVQLQMAANLTASNVAITHSGEKGSATEADWLSWFKTYLPKRYQADKAIVVDSKDRISDQIDAIIYDAQYSHLVFSHNNVKYIPAESVYCIFEIKQNLTKQYLDYAGKKARSVRLLHRTSTPIPHAGGVFDAKEPHFIPAGVLTLNSSWVEPLGATFMKNLLSLKNEYSIQLGCVIHEGAFSLSENDEIEISSKETALISFFFTLLSCLKKMATVPAIDLNAYARLLYAENSVLNKD